MLEHSEISLSEVVKLGRADWIALRSERATTLCVPLPVNQMVIVIACAPRNRVWLDPHFRELEPYIWMRERADALMEHGGLRRELRAARLKKAELPNGLIHVAGNCDRTRSWDEMWMPAMVMPEAFAAPLRAFIARWVDQLAERAFAEIDDRTWLERRWELDRTTRDGMGCLLDTIGGMHDFARIWTGDKGRLALLKSAVERLSRGERPSNIFSWETLALVTNPFEMQRDSFLRPASGRQARTDFCGERRTTSIRLLDTIFAYKARMVRLMDRSNYYRSALETLEREQQTAQRFPISDELPFDPFAELSAFLMEMAERFPVLAEDPYPELREWCTNGSPPLHSDA
jgi:hypothetical protein